MMKDKNREHVITFNENVRILDDMQNQIRLRIGIWNYDDAGLDLSNETEEFKMCIREIFAKMESGQGITYDNLDEYAITPVEKGTIIQLLDELKSAGVVCSAYERSLAHQVATTLLGNIYFDQEFEQEENLQNPILEQNNEKKLLFFADNDYAKTTAKHLAEEMDLAIDVMDENMFLELGRIDLTTNIDAFTTIKTINYYKEIMKPYLGVIGCLRHPSVLFVRNLNRVTWELEMQVTLAFMDGPFMSILSTTPPKTGCLECFELRNLARIEDHISYHRFVEAEKVHKKRMQIGKGAIPLLHLLTNMVISEGFLMNVLGTSRFSGRVLSVYLPTLEIQVQDLLRAPFCHACGAVAKSKLQETNVSSRVMIDDIITKVLQG